MNLSLTNHKKCIKRQYLEISAISRRLLLAILLFLGVFSLYNNPKTAIRSNFSQAISSELFTFFGHGYGHGIGLGQYGAIGDALLYGDTFQQILAQAYPGTAVINQPDSAVVVRVQISSEKNQPIVFSSPSPFTVSDDGSTNTINVPANQAVEITPDIPNKTYNASVIQSCSSSIGQVVFSNLKSLSVHPANTSINAPSSQTLELCENAHFYRGYFHIAFDGSGASQLVNSVNLSAYLDSVLPAEMPAYWGTLGPTKNGVAQGAQALMAQAIAARTYVLNRLNPNQLYDICDSTSCQAYPGESSENVLTDQLVNQTDSSVISSNGNLIDAMYSASTGGYSQQSLFSASPDQGDIICNTLVCNPYHSWQITLSATQIQSALNLSFLPVDISVTERTGNGYFSGRASQVRLSGSGESLVVSANQLVVLLSLPSNFFQVENTSGDASNYIAVNNSGAKTFSPGITQDGFLSSDLSQPSTNATSINYYFYYQNQVFGLNNSGQINDLSSPVNPFSNFKTIEPPIAGCSNSQNVYVIESNGIIQSLSGLRNLLVPQPFLSLDPDYCVYDNSGNLLILFTNGDILSMATGRVVGTYSAIDSNNANLIGVGPAPNNGVFLAYSDGTVMSTNSSPTFGDLQVEGIPGPATSFSVTPDENGYIISTAFGEIVPFGSAPELGDYNELGDVSPVNATIFVPQASVAHNDIGQLISTCSVGNLPPLLFSPLCNLSSDSGIEANQLTLMPKSAIRLDKRFYFKNK